MSEEEPGSGGLGGQSFGRALKCPFGVRGRAAGSGLQERSTILHLYSHVDA